MQFLARSALTYLFQVVILRPVSSRSHTVLKCTSCWSCRTGCLLPVTLSSGRTTISPTLGSWTFRFGKATVLLPRWGWCVHYRGYGRLYVIEARLQLGFRAGDADATEDKFETLTPCKLFDACFRARSLAEANE